jgi:hypothetical protein
MAWEKLLDGNRCTATIKELLAVIRPKIIEPNKCSFRAVM